MYILNPMEASKICEKYGEKINVKNQDYLKKCIDEPIAIKLCLENIDYLNRLFKINVQSVNEFKKVTKEKHKGIYRYVNAENKKKFWKNYILNLYYFYNDVGVPRLFKYNDRLMTYEEFLNNYNNSNYDLKISKYNIIRDVLF